MRLHGQGHLVLYLLLLVSYSLPKPTPQPTSVSLAKLARIQADVRRVFGALYTAANEAHYLYAKAHKFYPGDCPVSPYTHILPFFLPMFSPTTRQSATLMELVSQWSTQKLSVRFELCSITLKSFVLPLSVIEKDEVKLLGRNANSTVAVRKLETKFLRQANSALQYVVNSTGMQANSTYRRVDMNRMKQVIRGIAAKNGITLWSAKTLRNYAILEAFRDMVHCLVQLNVCQVRTGELTKAIS